MRSRTSPLGNGFKVARALAGLTTAELAEKASVGVSTIARIENGDYVPGHQRLHRIAVALKSAEKTNRQPGQGLAVPEVRRDCGEPTS